ncbi:extracellular solute-binding protein [Streptomyces sp. NBC_00237]|uniref:extracellular solute-binding protein n=1 Tax=Streptomyces sp. NBC_00237 TaxID=2975687 RepID=UPI00225448E8|nr:extracellular solute-binding protein [Streptomyces sp. NBC_00237]MCX5201623.1 extracellular solute-binding protein [Streptomyces sp. NBC_00237]
MRRGIAATALVAALALSATACGGGGGEGGAADGPVTVTWWDTSNATNEAPNYKALVKEFEAANKDIKVEYVNVPFEQAQNKFQTAAGSKGAPDVIRADVGWTGAWAKQQFLAPLDGTEALAKGDDFTPALLEQAKYAGKTYGVPLVTDSLALMWNKDLLKKAGFDKAPTTWDELKKVSKAVADKTDADGFWLNKAGYYQMPFLYGEGVDLIDAGKKKITVNSPQAAKAMETSKSLLASDGVAKLDVSADAYAHMQDAFVTGKVAMIVQGPWELTNIYKGAAFKDAANLGISTVPAGSTGTAGAPIGGHNLSVYAGSDAKRQKAAQKFVAFMTSGATQAKIALKNSTLPTRTSAYTAEVTALPGFAEMQKVLAQSGKARGSDPSYSSLYTDFETQVAQILQDKVSVPQGLDNTAGAFKKLLKDYS